MPEQQKKNSDRVVGYEKFKEKQPWRESEVESVDHPSPFKIRGEPIDFEKAKQELLRRIEERVKIKAEREAGNEASTSDFIRMMGEAEQLYLDTLKKLMFAQTAVLEKLKERDPEMTTFLLLQKNLDILKNVHDKIFLPISEGQKAISQKELEALTKDFRQLVQSLLKIS